MRHFVLVHGACHGAWCWYKVIAELKQAGHKVTALDLTACGIDRRQVEDVHGSVVEYSKPLLTFMASLPAAGSDDEKVILVGHSMAGSSLCMAMERFPEKISVAAFLAAGMLGPDLTSQMVDEKVFVELSPTADTMDSQVIYGDGPDKPPTGFLLGPKHMETHLYRCSPRQDLELGITLVRPCPIWDAEEAARDTVLTNDRYGTVARAYVVCDEEKDGAFQWWLIENNPPDEHVVIPGSDHMVMFSQPSLLSEYLLQLAAKYI
ncbi:unnamed protein product [Linum tenue]|uniref:AB hydrolase-1 domain-containing protein n=1 Tax=Linum tenue TaxID=586396 RepID=A0AAV0JFJ9_9ROSI|nr:unnamed protein product [Linum tenue]